MNDMQRMIREYAYQLWDCAGRPEGSSEEFWFVAKAEFVPKDEATRERRLVSHARRSAEVANALFWDLTIPRYRVTVEEDRGWVTLHGVVERAYQRSCAEDDVRRVPGVMGVTNEITVGAAQDFH